MGGAWLCCLRRNALGRTDAKRSGTKFLTAQYVLNFPGISSVIRACAIFRRYHMDRLGLIRMMLSNRLVRGTSCQTGAETTPFLPCLLARVELQMTLRILFYEGCTSSPTSYDGLRWQLGRLSSRTLVVLDKYTCASLARLAWVLMLRSDPMRWQPSWTDSGLYDRSMTIKIPLGLSSTERVGPNEIGYC